MGLKIGEGRDEPGYEKGGWGGGVGGGKGEMGKRKGGIGRERRVGGGKKMMEDEGRKK